jgi:hypothetical protein
VLTTADIQAGFACSSDHGCEHGEPFHVRGIVGSAIRF